VLLQGARRDPAGAFLSRIQSILKTHVGGEPKLLSDILVHPVEKDRIEALLSGSAELLLEDPAPASPGGSGGPEA
jgi:hypothetical protein